MLRCPCCELQKKELYCAECLCKGVATHNQLGQTLRSQADHAVAIAEQCLAGPVRLDKDRTTRGVNEWRQLRAQVAATEDRVAALRAEVRAKSKDIKRARDAVARSDVRSREENVEAARRSRLTPADLQAQIAFVRRKQHEVGKRVIHARRLLYREAVEVFGIRQRPDGNWEIAGMLLPPPEAFRQFPYKDINAALMHTVHFLSLVTRYLSISIPFEPTPPAPLHLPHVGRPVMFANLPFPTTSRWRSGYVLWMSSSAVVPVRAKGTSATAHRAAVAAVLAKSSLKHRATLIAFALLAHSVAYLAWSQGVNGVGIYGAPSARDSDDEGARTPPPTASFMGGDDGVLVSATAVLDLLHRISESTKLGIRGHEPGTTEVVKHMKFGLDVSKVVGAVLDPEDARWGRRPGKEELSEGWDLMEMDAALPS